MRLTLALLALLVAGCGAAEKPPVVARPAATASPAPMEVEVAITAPKAGARLKAGRPLRVSGTATPDATVLLTAGCGKAGCEAIARAGAAGRWRATLTPRDPQTTIEASTPSGDAADRVQVRVSVPARTKAAPPTSEVEPTATTRPRPTRVVVVGDSLAVGIKALLPDLLPGYSVSVDALTGRPLAAGMKIIGASDVQGSVLAVSLFTNDDPRSVDALESAVRSTVSAVGAGGCAVWATIVRPPFGGVSYRAANARLAALETELSPRLILVPWAQTVAAQPDLVAGDGVHGTPAGYQARAALYAEAIQSCGG